MVATSKHKKSGFFQNLEEKYNYFRYEYRHVKDTLCFFDAFTCHLLHCLHRQTFIENQREIQRKIMNPNIFKHASVSSTYPCKLVRPLVGPSVTLLDFQSLVSNGRSNQKSSKNKIHLFSNFASGRTLPTHKNVYEGLNALKCI